MKKEFLVVFEVGKTGLGASAPDIPGCFAVGPTLEETRRRYLKAAEAHLKWLAADRDPIPAPRTTGFDFAPRSKGKNPRYYVEWLPVPIPQRLSPRKTMRAA
jgi:predicted RNase H-like HicB family nuclease